MFDFTSKAETSAAKAQSLHAFQHVNLLGIRNDVAEMLSQVGKNNIFSDYTKHDITHINALLKSLDWIIPDDTKLLLSPADWLMIVLSVYFHDLGLLVTKSDWEGRRSTSFENYRSTVKSGEKGEEYAAKVHRMPADQAEKFLYQEFVRENHAKRLRIWISGSSDRSVGGDPVVISEIRRILIGFDSKFTRDLALVCESHHLNDLDDLAKYKVRQPYGNSAEETCNLQYAAIILRTADLLHVTQDRTPSIAFRLINPTDPKSIVEWRKQMSVVAVQPVPAKDKDGNVTHEQQSTSIGFHAYFKDHEGFFALSGYLNWAKDELRKSADWIEKARRREGSLYSFPWQHIDESDIEAAGFLKKEFQFTLDQGKILDLLTGHTLYNDANVVIRELVQNGIDAIRLDAVEDGKEIVGKVKIEWSAFENLLSIQDTGTGMTQEIIERHFLRAGSSRYQDSEFKKTFPNFSPISRFGIGVLSAFMIADEVEVFTVSKVIDEKPRKLTLRTLHGRYLIEEFERSAPEIPFEIRDHGTKISLRIRAGAEPVSVLQAAKRWIVFPPCEVSVLEDGKDEVKIGFATAKDAVLDTLRVLGIGGDDKPDSRTRYEVREFCEDGLQLAVAVEWSSHFKEWSFLQTTNFVREWDEDDVSLAGIGTCVEGIRVDFDTPGFHNIPLIAVANATGKTSPRTNVARSSFESTPERKQMFSKIYDMYAKHVSLEVFEMHSQRNFSPTWAVGEASYLLGPLLARNDSGEVASPLDLQMMETSISKVPCMLIERGGQRDVVSLDDINQIRDVWTLDSSGVRSLELLIREIPRALSLTSVSKLMEEDLIKLPDEPALAGIREGSVLLELALRSREVQLIKVSQEDRRIDLQWRLRDKKHLWRSLRSGTPKVRRFIRNRLSEGQRTRQSRDILLAADPSIVVSGLQGEIAVRSCGMLFFMPGNDITNCLLEFVDRSENGGLNPEVLLMINIAMVELLGRVGAIESPREYLSRLVATNPRMALEQGQVNETILSDAFVTAVGAANWAVFDASAWSRGPAVTYGMGWTGY